MTKDFRTIGELRKASMGETMTARVIMPAETLARLQDAARAMHTTYSEIIRVLVAEWLDAHADVETWEIRATMAIGGEVMDMPTQTRASRKDALEALRSISIDAKKRLDDPAVRMVGGSAETHASGCGEVLSVTVKRPIRSRCAQLWAGFDWHTGEPVCPSVQVTDF